MITYWKLFSELTGANGNNAEYAEAIKAEQEKERLKREPAQTAPDEWRALLQELSDLVIANEEIRGRLTASQIEKRWLGEPPATQAQIEAAELRLGIRLPPSYRAFLQVSNGWHYPNSFVAQVAGTEEIDFTRNVDPELIAAWKESFDAGGEDLPETHLESTILINVPSDYDDAANLMLNPATMRDGEMEAWFFSSWNPGADAHPSFWHLMASQAIDWRSAPTDGK